MATPQAMAYSDAQDLWKKQAPGVYGAADAAYRGMGAAVGQSGAALSRLGGFNPSNIAAYSPTALQGFDPSSYLTGPSGAASAYAAKNKPVAAAVAPTDWSAATSAAGALEGFDPSKAGKEYAGGAISEFNQDLSTQLAALERKSTGTGRLETGFYTGDQGTVATNLGKDYNSKLAQAALTFSGQRLSALQGGAGAYANIAATQGQEAQAKANEADYVALSGRGQDLSALTSEEGMGVGEQEQASSQAYGRASALASMGYQKARDMDTLGLQASTTGLEAALQEEQMARSGYNTAASAAAGYTSGTRDWAAMDKQSQDEIDFNTALAKYRLGQGGLPTGPGGPVLSGVFGGGGFGGSGAQQNDPYALMRLQARQLGVPFRS